MTPKKHKKYKKELIMSKNTIQVRAFRDGASIPEKSTALAAGYDIRAWTAPVAGGSRREVIAISPGSSAIIKTGLNLSIPEGYEVQIRPRSGLAAKKSIGVLNSPGTIDADYDGEGENFEVGIILFNHGDTQFEVNHGDRIAQMVVCKLPEIELVEVTDENHQRKESQREGGFGHTGV